MCTNKYTVNLSASAPIISAQIECMSQLDSIQLAVADADNDNNLSFWTNMTQSIIQQIIRLIVGIVRKLCKIQLHVMEISRLKTDQTSIIIVIFI